MSGLILCREKTVTHPYYVKELGIHLYTGEELSYFICHNILLIDEDFVDERLFDFLEQLGETRLCERARRLAEQAGLFDVLYLPSPGDLPDPEIEPSSPFWQADSLPAEPPGK